MQNVFSLFKNENLQIVFYPVSILDYQINEYISSLFYALSTHNTHILKYLEKYSVEGMCIYFCFWQKSYALL